MQLMSPIFSTEVDSANNKMIFPGAINCLQGLLKSALTLNSSSNRTNEWQGIQESDCVLF